MIVKINQVQRAIVSGANWLKSQQTENGSFIFKGRYDWDIWDTANALIALLKVGENAHSPVVKKAKDFLIQSQNKNGSFYHASHLNWKKIKENKLRYIGKGLKHPVRAIKEIKNLFFKQEARYCIETTSVALIALYHSSNRRKTEECSRGLKFLKNHQSKNGGWSIGYHLEEKDRYFPSVTGFALSALICLGENHGIESGLTFLGNTQTESGDWGINPIYYSSHYYPIRVNIIPFILSNRSSSGVVKKAVEFIKNTQDEDGGFGNREGNDLCFRSDISREVKTALALNALIMSGESVYSSHVQNGLRWLLKRQRKDGRWIGGRLYGIPKEEDLYATSQAIMTLVRYFNILKNEEEEVKFY
jgi:squalene cyclase